MHPSSIPMVMWAAFALLSLLTAIRAHQPAWAALAMFSLPSAILNAVAVARGMPHASLEAVKPLDRALIDVVGRDCFAVMGQDHMETPYILRRRNRPELVVELSFVSGLDRDAIRGFAALQHAALTDQNMAGLRQRVTIVRWLLIIGFGIAAYFLAPTSARTFAPFATAGIAFWLPGAVLDAWWSRSRGQVARERQRQDRVAADLLGEPGPVATALVAIAGWRADRRADRPLVLRALQRLVTPVLYNGHEAQRAAALTGTE